MKGRVKKAERRRQKAEGGMRKSVRRVGVQKWIWRLQTAWREFLQEARSFLAAVGLVAVIYLGMRLLSWLANGGG